jgi:hypothetical protein
VSNFIELNPASQESVSQLEEHLSGISREHLIETALAITAALYQKASEGAVIKLEYQNGKVEELRFKVRRKGRKKPGAETA